MRSEEIKIIRRWPRLFSKKLAKGIRVLIHFFPHILVTAELALQGITSNV